MTEEKNNTAVKESKKATPPSLDDILNKIKTKIDEKKENVDRYTSKGNSNKKDSNTTEQKKQSSTNKKQFTNERKTPNFTNEEFKSKNEKNIKNSIRNKELEKRLESKFEAKARQENKNITSEIKPDPKVSIEEKRKSLEEKRNFEKNNIKEHSDKIDRSFSSLSNLLNKKSENKNNLSKKTDKIEKIYNSIVDQKKPAAEPAYKKETSKPEFKNFGKKPINKEDLPPVKIYRNENQTENTNSSKPAQTIENPIIKKEEQRKIQTPIEIKTEQPITKVAEKIEPQIKAKKVILLTENMIIHQEKSNIINNSKSTSANKNFSNEQLNKLSEILAIEISNSCSIKYLKPKIEKAIKGRIKEIVENI